MSRYAGCCAAVASKGDCLDKAPARSLQNCRDRDGRLTESQVSRLICQ